MSAGVKYINPFSVVREFEAALCDYTGAPYAVTTTSCTMALLLACAWHLRPDLVVDNKVTMPKRTYVGVPMSVLHAGGQPAFRDEVWRGCYQLEPLPVWDCARWLTSQMYGSGGSRLYSGAIEEEARVRIYGVRGTMLCLSFHWSKHLAIGQGGAILHDDPKADAWLRRARFDGRMEGVDAIEQAQCGGFNVVGWHAYMMPRDAAEGLTRLALLPRHNEPLPPSDYPDLSKLEIFKQPALAFHTGKVDLT